MIIIKVQGGLGNQMFQYALYKKFELMNKEVFLDITAYETHKKHNGFEIVRIFNISPKFAAQDQINLLASTNKTLFQKVLRNVYRKPSHYTELQLAFTDSLFNKESVYLDGYWQTEKYFEDIKEIIRDDFTYKGDLGAESEQILSQILKTNSVSLHIRRGDYIKKAKARKIYGNIATLKYYEKAVDLIRSKEDSPIFYIFSDDIDWVKENLPIEESVFVNCNKKEESFKDMILMSKCKHNIIANSSFSWWGAWLNQYSKKIIICPNKWLNTQTTPDIYCDGWIKVDGTHERS